MKTNASHSLILSLIKDDLIHSKLVNGLIDLGLDASPYFTNLGHTVLGLMGFSSSLANEACFEFYLALCRQAQRVDISAGNTALDALAEDIYQHMQQIKQWQKEER